jgi:hypothetical protein
MSNNGRTGCPLLLVLIGVLLAILMSSGGSLKSPDETNRILRELGVRWRGGGPPIVMFTNPG